ncbi:MAG: hypothetical protein D6806_16050 [Deltaproteobacteria bacterium]|nr:MAG: hypothetical protein D6806_16050 [Deltaproteobacteria bacterium]
MGLKTAVLVLIFCLLAACGGGEECHRYDECTSGQNGLCLSGKCRYYSDDLFASLVVDVSFPREMVATPASGKIWLFHSVKSDGSVFDCRQATLLSSPYDDKGLNPLLAEPRHLVFNCCGTFYPDNLVQFVQPASSAVVVGEAYPDRNATGKRVAFGCLEGLSIDPLSRVDATLSMKEE